MDVVMAGAMRLGAGMRGRAAKGRQPRRIERACRIAPRVAARSAALATSVLVSRTRSAIRIWLAASGKRDGVAGAPASHSVTTPASAKRALKDVIVASLP